MNFKELYSELGEVCLLCAHFKPDLTGTAEMENKAMRVIAKSSEDVPEAEEKDQAAVYGHCKVGKQGMFALQTCETTFEGRKQFMINYDGLQLS